MGMTGYNISLAASVKRLTRESIQMVRVRYFTERNMKVKIEFCSYFLWFFVTMRPKSILIPMSLSFILKQQFDE